MVACTKGGCAKTITTYNRAYLLKEFGKKVLCVDFDSQENLSTCFGVEDTAVVLVTVSHLMMVQIEDEELPVVEEYMREKMVQISFLFQCFCKWWMQNFVLKWNREDVFMYFESSQGQI